MSFAVLIALALAGAVLFSALGVWLGRAGVRQRLEGHHEVLGALLQTGGTMHAVFLAFLVVAVWQSYDSARANVADEASALTTLYRASVALDPSVGPAVRQAVHDYTASVVADEWAIQADSGGASETARAAGLALYRIFGDEPAEAKQVRSAIDGAALALLSQIQSDRNRRTLSASQSLPAIVWFAVVGSGAIVLVMSFVLLMDQVRTQVLATSLLACTIALLLCTTLVLSHPFSGPMAIQPGPFAHSLDVFRSVDAMVASSSRPQNVSPLQE